MISIRPATTGDIDIIAHLHVEGWKGAYGGIVDPAYLDALNVEDKKLQWKGILQNEDSKILIAEQESHAVGFLNYGKLRTPPPGTSRIRPLYSGEIMALYILPDYYRQGIGKMLTREAVKGLMEMKHKSMCLWVLDKNDRAKKFYDAMGGQRIGKQMIEIGPTKAKEICYGWRDISSL